jgi:hypothetical protein
MTTNNLHKPAPTQQIANIKFYLYQRRKMYMGIYGWARAGFRDCQLLANILGETRPYQIRKMYVGFMVGRGRVLEICQLLANIVGETRPYQIRKMYIGIYRWARAGFRDLSIIGKYCR